MVVPAAFDRSLYQRSTTENPTIGFPALARVRPSSAGGEAAHLPPRGSSTLHCFPPIMTTMTILPRSTDNQSVRAIHDRWLKVVPNLASTVVATATCVATWLLATEIIFQAAAFDRRLPEDLSVWVLMDTALAMARGLEVPSIHGDVLTALAYAGIAALPLVSLVLSLAYAWVRAERKIGRDHRRHVAFAWSSGILGLLCVFIEALSIADFKTEDLLIGIGALNMLVEECRILEAQLKRELAEQKAANSGNGAVGGPHS